MRRAQARRRAKRYATWCLSPDDQFPPADLKPEAILEAAANAPRVPTVTTVMGKSVTPPQLSIIPSYLLHLHPGHLDDVRPFLDVFAQVRVELLRRLHQRNRALLEPQRLHFGFLDHFVDGL